MIQFALLTLGLVAAIGCAPMSADQPQMADQPSQGQDEIQSRPLRACYAGRGSNPDCFATVERSQLSEQQSLYLYSDPHTDSTFPPSFNKAQYIAPDRLLDLRDIGSGVWLSPNFQRKELLPNGADRGHFGLLSTQALNGLEKIRLTLGKPVFITSGFRSPGHNQKIDGAAKWSRHTYGDGIDFKVSGVSYKRLAELCMQAGASFYQLYSDHIHCDWRNSRLDSAFFASVSQKTQAISSAAVALASRIDVELQLRSDFGQDTVLSAYVPQEDGGELLHEWQILTPDGQIIASHEPRVTLPSTPGTYQVKARVGGSVLIERLVEVR